jgi:hypothetical protein
MAGCSMAGAATHDLLHHVRRLNGHWVVVQRVVQLQLGQACAAQGGVGRAGAGMWGQSGGGGVGGGVIACVC